MSDTWTDDDDEMVKMNSNTTEGAFIRLRFSLDECKRAFMRGWRRGARERRERQEQDDAS